MWWRNVFLALIGISAGMVVAGGVFSFIVELGVISDFADRTHTAKHILFYEDMVSAGAVLGNLFQIFEVHLPGRSIFLGIFGLFGGIFVGCWAMALAEILNIYAPGKNRSIPGSVCADVSTWKRLRGRIVFLEKMVDKSIQRKDEMAAKSPDRLMPGLSCMSDLIRI